MSPRLSQQRTPLRCSIVIRSRPALQSVCSSSTQSRGWNCWLAAHMWPAHGRTGSPARAQRPGGPWLSTPLRLQGLLFGCPSRCCALRPTLREVLGGHPHTHTCRDLLLEGGVNKHCSVPCPPPPAQSSPAGLHLTC